MKPAVFADVLERFESIKFASRAVKRGNYLFNAGDALSHLYSISSGFFKTSILDRQGREQVSGFFMSDELIGLDGLCGGRHQVSAVALEDSIVCLMPYAVVEALAQQTPSLQRALNAALAREVARTYGVMMLLGSTKALERVASFLVNLSRRQVHRGLSGSSFRLSMSRGEIGSYLGLTLETVSRTFSTFHRSGLMNVRQRDLSVVDVEGLERILEDR